MSVIRKKPFIEMVIDSLSPAMKDALAGVLNNQPATINRDSSFADMPSNNTVTAVYFKLDETNFKNGILIYNNSYCVLVAYHRFQDLLIYQLNVTAKQYRKINEYLDINELRRVLNDRVGSDIDAGEIDSGDAANNKVLTADGAGGAFWDDKVNYLVLTGESGTLTAEQLAVAQLDSAVAQLGDNGKLYYKESQSNYYIVFSASPLVSGDTTYIEKITVNVTDRTWSYEAQAIAAGEGFNPEYDNALSDSSTNAVQNKVITEALEEKANVDGNYPTMTVGVADQLSPYDDESGDDQDEPFSFQATGTGNGSQPDFSTGAIALMKEKQGNTVVVNQYFAKTTYSGTNDGITYGWNKDTRHLSIQGTATTSAGNSILTPEPNIPVGHKVLFLFTNYKNEGSNFNLFLNSSYDVYISLRTTSNPTSIIELSSPLKSVFGYNNGQELNLETDLAIIDLTQWFNGDIPQDLLDNPSNFFRYYQGSLAYNEGTLVNADGRYIKCIGMNQWDEDVKTNYYWDTTGSQAGSANYDCSNKKIRVIPNKKIVLTKGSGSTYNHSLFYLRFFDKDGNVINSEDSIGATYQFNNTINIPSNCVEIGINSAYQTKFDNNPQISVNLYYEDEARCLIYEPYEVLTNNDTGTEVLRSAGSVKDYKTPDGTIHRLVGVVDLGTLTWTLDASGVFTAVVSGLKNNSYTSKNLDCAKYFIAGVSIGDMPDKSIRYAGYDSYIFIKDTSYNDAAAFKTAMSGVYLHYELAEPTTEQGTSYSENLVIDDFGSMDFQGTNGVPQGNLIFYPVDYKAFIDTLYDYTEGTPSNIALKSDLAVVDNKIGAKLPECPTTTDGTYVLKATVADGEVVYAWVLEE